VAGELRAVQAALVKARYELRALGWCMVALFASGTLSMGHALNLPEGRDRLKMYLPYRLLRSASTSGQTSTNGSGRVR
jgi:hypothetical protein